MFEGKQGQATSGERGSGSQEQGIEPRVTIEGMEDIGQHHHQRALLEVFGVDEGGGVYVLICGLILGGLTITACCYCKVYDPLRLWCVKTIKHYCKRKSKPPAEPEREAPPSTDVRKHSKGPLPVVKAKTRRKAVLRSGFVGNSSRYLVEGLWPARYRLRPTLPATYFAASHSVRPFDLVGPCGSRSPLHVLPAGLMWYQPRTAHDHEKG